EPLQMLGAITWMYRKLIEASEVRGVTNGWQAARALGMRPEQAELALQSARKIPKTHLLAGLGALQRADDRLKGGREDARAVMEFLLRNLTCLKQKPAKEKKNKKPELTQGSKKALKEGGMAGPLLRSRPGGCYGRLPP